MIALDKPALLNIFQRAIERSSREIQYILRKPEVTLANSTARSSRFFKLMPTKTPTTRTEAASAGAGTSASMHRTTIVESIEEATPTARGWRCTVM